LSDFDLQLYEGQTSFDVIYGTIANNFSATGGVQQSDTNYTQ